MLKLWASWLVLLPDTCGFGQVCSVCSSFCRGNRSPHICPQRATTAKPHDESEPGPVRRGQRQGTSGNVQIIYDRLDNGFVIGRRVTTQQVGINHYTRCIAVLWERSVEVNPVYAYVYKTDSVIPSVASSNKAPRVTTMTTFPTGRESRLGLNGSRTRQTSIFQLYLKPAKRIVPILPS